MKKGIVCDVSYSQYHVFQQLRQDICGSEELSDAEDRKFCSNKSEKTCGKYAGSNEGKPQGQVELGGFTCA